MKTVGIVIDKWKLPIFERHLKQHGYSFEHSGPLTTGTLLLQVDTTNLEALGVVLKAANTEAAMTEAAK